MRAAIVGGGLAGLFTAIELVAHGVDDVVVLEEGPEAGGVARTMRRDGYAIETGPATLTLPHPDLSPILERIGVDVRPVEPDKTTRYVFRSGELIEVPASPRVIGSPVVPFPARMRALAEALVPARTAQSDEDLDTFCRRRFGAHAGGLIADLMATGVFAGDARRLSAGAAFPRLVALERESGSVLRGALSARRARGDLPRPQPSVPVAGMGAVVAAASRHLGDRVSTDHRVDRITRSGAGWALDGSHPVEADVVVIATGPSTASHLLESSDLAEVLRRAKSAPVAVVAIGGAGPPPIEGFGLLVASGEEMITRGVLFESSYAPERAPEGSWLIRVVAGGATRPQIAGWSEGQIAETVLVELDQVIGSVREASVLEVIRHTQGIPQYEVGHSDWLSTVEKARAGLPGLFLTGWAYRGVGVNQVATDAVRTRAEVLAS